MNCTNLKLSKPRCSFGVPSVYCIVDTVEKVLEELDTRFPIVAMLDALGMVYPQYWLQGDCEANFQKHLMVIKEFYGKPRSTMHDGCQIVVPHILDKYSLECQ